MERQTSHAHSVKMNVILLLTTFPAFLTPFMGSSINIALPSIGRDLEMDAVLLSWVSTSYHLAIAMFLVPFGRIADIYGRKKIFLCGVFLFAFSCVPMALSTSGFLLIFFRFLQGIGSSMIFGTGIAILTSVFPPEAKGKVLGINAAATYLGISLGPLVGGFLTQQMGWRTIFWINVPLGFMMVVLILLHLKGEWAEAKGESFDVAGAVIYCFALTALIYGVSILPIAQGAGLILVGLLGIWMFILYEPKARSPLFDIHLFSSNKLFAFSNLSTFINYCATYATLFLLSLYLQYLKGFSPQDAGMILASHPVTQAIFSPLAGKYSDRIEPKIMAAIGMALSTVGLIAFVFLDENTPVRLIVIVLIFLGFGAALFATPNTNAIMSSVDKKNFGLASGTLGTMRVTGMTFSMGIVIVVFAFTMRRVQITSEYYPLFLKGVKTAFGIYAFLCFGGIFASLGGGRLRQKC